VTYPTASPEQVAAFREHGWLVVDDAIDPADLGALEERCTTIIENKEKMAFDWAWEKGTDAKDRPFKILQSSPSLFWKQDFEAARFRTWAIEFGSALLGDEVEFWYDQFLAKPPGHSAATRWHQDEAYWGRNLDERGITCWMPFHDVDATNGCMHFIDGSHKDGVLEHKLVAGVKSDLLHCEPDESRMVACEIGRGSVTFHHSATVHMTTANDTDRWRKALTQHFQTPDAGGEGGHYPWKIYVDQRTGETFIPPRG